MSMIMTGELVIQASWKKWPWAVSKWKISSAFHWLLMTFWKQQNCQELLFIPCWLWQDCNKQSRTWQLAVGQSQSWYEEATRLFSLFEFDCETSTYHLLFPLSGYFGGHMPLIWTAWEREVCCTLYKNIPTVHTQAISSAAMTEIYLSQMA